MKIAIPLFRTRVSPRFDCAQQFWVLEVKNNQIIEQQDLQIKEKIPIQKIRKLTRLGIDILICGGIDRFSERHFYFFGIKLFSWITGEAKDIIQCFLEGKLESGMMMGDDGRCCGRWRFRGGRGPCMGGDCHKAVGRIPKKGR